METSIRTKSISFLIPPPKPLNLKAGTQTQAGLVFENDCKNYFMRKSNNNDSINYAFNYEGNALAEFDGFFFLNNAVEKNDLFEIFKILYESNKEKYFPKDSLLILESKIRMFEKDDNIDIMHCELANSFKEGCDKLYKNFFIPLICSSFVEKIIGNEKEISKIYLIFVSNGKDPRARIKTISNLFDLKWKDYDLMINFLNSTLLTIKEKVNNKKIRDFVDSLWDKVEVMVCWIDQESLHNSIQKENDEKIDQIQKENKEKDEKIDQIQKENKEKDKKIKEKDEKIKELEESNKKTKSKPILFE